MFFSFLFSLLSACTQGSLPPDSVTPATVNKTALLQLVNDARKKGCQCGTTWYPAAPAVGWNDQLEKAAYAHSKDMAANNYFSHDGKDGSGPEDRITQAGYNWKTYGENIGLGYSSEKEVVESWLKSPGHCRNIMNASHKEIGAAKVGRYWTMNLGSR